MNLLDYLDMRHARNMAYKSTRPYRPLDFKLFTGALFLAGYYAIVALLGRVAIPEPNAGLVRDALLVLGPAVGAVVNALFRTDQRDEQQARNTQEGFKALGEQAKATAVATVAAATGGLNPDDRPAGTIGDPVHTVGEGEPVAGPQSRAVDEPGDGRGA